VDLVLLDIKSFNPLTYRQVTGTSIEPTLRFAQYLNGINKPTWIRFVLVPNLTDDPDNIEGLAKFISQLKNVEKVEVSPFHQLGEYKWEKLGYTYHLQDTPVPTSEQIHQVKDCFRRYGLSVQ
jgi:pyruvate formate lyase activating enzyme